MPDNLKQLAGSKAAEPDRIRKIILRSPAKTSGKISPSSLMHCWIKREFLGLVDVSSRKADNGKDRDNCGSYRLVNLTSVLLKPSERTLGQRTAKNLKASNPMIVNEKLV